MSAPSSSSRRSRGFTLLEMTVSVSILVVILGAAMYTLVNASTEVRAGVWETDLDMSARRVMNRLAEEITSTGRDIDGTNYVMSHLPGATTTAASFTFHRRVGVANDGTDWSTEITFSLADAPGEDSDNGIDDDGDGAVDEQLLVRTQDGEEKIIVDGVTAFTVTRNSGDNFVTIGLTLARPNRIGMTALERTTTTSVRFRNLGR